MDDPDQTSFSTSPTFLPTAQGPSRTARARCSCELNPTCSAACRDAADRDWLVPVMPFVHEVSAHRRADRPCDTFSPGCAYFEACPNGRGQAQLFVASASPHGA